MSLTSLLTVFLHFDIFNGPQYSMRPKYILMKLIINIFLHIELGMVFLKPTVEETFYKRESSIVTIKSRIRVLRYRKREQKQQTHVVLLNDSSYYWIFTIKVCKGEITEIR